MIFLIFFYRLEIATELSYTAISGILIVANPFFYDAYPAYFYPRVVPAIFTVHRIRFQALDLVFKLDDIGCILNICRIMHDRFLMKRVHKEHLCSRAVPAPRLRITMAEFTSRSWTAPHAEHSQPLTLSPFHPVGPVKEPHLEQVLVVFIELTNFTNLP
jgi:hypothetical protein